MATFNRFERYLVPATGVANSWIATLVATFVIALAYCLAAQVGLTLLAKPSDVAVFWPAAGVAAGILIAGGRRAGVAVVVGVVVGTVAANLMSDRALLTSILKGFCNAGEGVLMAWLLDRWFGRPFAFGDLRHVVGFFAAAVLATATSAIGGAVTMTTFHTSAPFWDAWRTWFLSGAVGIVIVAPFLIELFQLRREQPTRWEMIEGIGVVILAALACIYAVSLPTGSWLSFDSDAIVFPLLLWLTVRNQRTFAIAGALVVSIVVIGATTYGIGHFGDVSVSAVERVLGAQLVATMVTAFTLVITALFAERRKSEKGLRESEERLRLAQLKTGVGIWDWHLRTGKMIWTPQLEAIFGLKQGTVNSYGDFRDRVHPDDIEAVEAQRDAAVRRNETFNCEFRIIRADGQVRWISAVGGTIYDEATGEPVRILGNNIDITERKLAEEALAERSGQLALAGKAARVGNFSYEPEREIMQISEGYATMHGFPEGTAAVARSQCLAGVHARDVERVVAARSNAFRERRKDYSVEYRIVRPGGEVRWVETRCFISYDSEARPHRVVGVSIDVTERRHAEDHKSALIAELDHRVKNILACVAVVAQRSRDTSKSLDDFLKVLEARLSSLANTHSLLSRNRWQGVNLAELVRGELAPCAKDGNTLIEGPDVVLAAEATQAVSMVLHELVTNASKYGALSNGHGQVSVCWCENPNGATSGLVLEWLELGGPAVAAANSNGYGTSVIRDLIPYELGGTVDYELAAAGARCRLQLPAKWLNPRSPLSLPA